MGAGLRLERDFFIRDVLDVAPELPGKQLTLSDGNNITGRYILTEVEAYRGYEDLACHAGKGRTPRTEIMFHEGGNIYVYFIYGMYWMFNIVTGKADEPQAVLIRGIEGYNGPGKLTKALGIDRSFYGEDMSVSDRIWLEDIGLYPEIKRGPRIGINYAGEYWANVPWRYFIDFTGTAPG